MDGFLLIPGKIRDIQKRDIDDLKPIEYAQRDKNYQDIYYISSHKGTSFKTYGFLESHSYILAHNTIPVYGIKEGRQRYETIS